MVIIAAYFETYERGADEQFAKYFVSVIRIMLIVDSFKSLL